MAPEIFSAAGEYSFPVDSKLIDISLFILSLNFYFFLQFGLWVLFCMKLLPMHALERKSFP
jgi:hypothetical protein